MLWNPLYNQHFTFNAKNLKIIRKMNRNTTYPSKYYPAHPERLVPRIEISSRDHSLITWQLSSTRKVFVENSRPWSFSFSHSCSQSCFSVDWINLHLFIEMQDFFNLDLFLDPVLRLFDLDFDGDNYSGINWIENIRFVLKLFQRLWSA